MNNMLYIQSFTDADDALKLHHVVHCSLDVIEERGSFLLHFHVSPLLFCLDRIANSCRRKVLLSSSSSSSSSSSLAFSTWYDMMMVCLLVVHVAEDVKPKKVLVRHLETLTDSETPLDIIHSLFESDLDEQSCSKGMFIAEKGTVLDKSCTSATDHCTECSVQANMAE